MERIPRGQNWTVAVLGLLVVMLGFAAVTILDGFHPDGYRAAHMDPTVPWKYPTDDVETFLGLMAAEFAFSFLVLWSRSRSSIGARAAFLGGIYFCGVLALAPLSMHAPSPIIDHIVWLFFASVFLVLFSIVSGVLAVIAKRRARALGTLP